MKQLQIIIISHVDLSLFVLPNLGSMYLENGYSILNENSNFIIIYRKRERYFENEILTGQMNLQIIKKGETNGANKTKICFGMGNSDTKLNFRKAVIQLTTKTQPIEANDEAFWEQFWSDSVTGVQDVFTLIPAAEIRALREESPSNLATLCYKAVEKLVAAAEMLNCVRLLIRVLPYIFEDPDWRGFFWSTLPGQAEETENESPPLAQSLVNALSDLLFCPDFTVPSNRKAGPDNPEDMTSIDSCEYIWESGVGFAHSPPHNLMHDQNRSEIIRLLLTCFSETIHALPLFTSLLNVVCAYDPVGYGVPYNHLMFSDSREAVVEGALQVLCVTLENESSGHNVSVDGTSGGTAMEQDTDTGGPDNLFVNYLSRIHREEDFHFILKGITRLLNNPLTQTYLPGSCKKIQFHQELLVLFWKMCDINKKFMFYVLKSSDVLDVLVPILYFLNDARADQSKTSHKIKARVGLMHIGVFILLLLSGERNFGVRLNKPYTVRVPMDIPVFHKIITTGHQRLQPLFDCLLTIIVNVSPYLKTLSMVASTKLLHLLEAFSTPWFLYASPTNHHLVFFLLEVFNNIIQYQFDGNCNLVYTIIRKRNVFHQLANLPTDHSAIAKALTKRGKKFTHTAPDTKEPQTMEGAIPAAEAEPGTLKVSLAATPRIDKMTEKAAPDEGHRDPTLQELASSTGSHNVQPPNEIEDPTSSESRSQAEGNTDQPKMTKSKSLPTPPSSPTSVAGSEVGSRPPLSRTSSAGNNWVATPDWTIMRMLQVLVPQVEKICIDKGLTDESEILKFLQHGTLVGLLPVPHPILIRKYQANSGTTILLNPLVDCVILGQRKNMNVDPPIWYDTNVKLFEIQRV
ncbi:hypothetical protein KUTeg_002937 [Tegillarca granosa]|uniref:HID1 domain containing b n=1 Tax=Tegillarca granosa TaxID=220873 RepID=A0ABQ9FNW2_TEGGR|nr:hypothetical protein KUTeg_002937 [Tegillarca granosa]